MNGSRICSDTLKTLRFVIPSVIPASYESPTKWAERNIRFARARDPIPGPLDLKKSPYLIEPLEAWQIKRGQGRKEITFMAPEQMGKTLFWSIGLLWRMEKRPGISLIYYTSAEKAALVNEMKIEPLLEAIPRYRQLLDLPGCKNKQLYRLGENLVYFSGVGARISSISAPVCIADELDDWLDTKNSVGALNDLRKRSDAFGDSILAKVCTPKGTRAESAIAAEFDRSSQGYYFLRCLGCGKWTIRSADIHRLQFEVEEVDGIKHAVDGSCRLVCPECKHAHEEADKAAMIVDGKYIHKFPDRLRSMPGFQVGKLASLFTSGNWSTLAAAQLAAGRTGDEKAQRYFDNSVRGLPFKFRKLEEKGAAALRVHQGDPPPDGIKFLFLSADTQDDCFYWVVRGIDYAENSWLLAAGKADTVSELRAAIAAEYGGKRPICSIIDEGGHRQQEVRELTKLPGVFCYKGNPRIGTTWKMSEDFGKLVLANARHYHLLLLRRIYAKANVGDHYMHFPAADQMRQDYVEQITSWRENPAVRHGDELEHYYLPEGRADHYYDAEKMLLVLVDVFKALVLPRLRRSKSRIVRE